MGYDDASHWQTQEFGDEQLFRVLVKTARELVEQQQAWLPVKRSREQDTLYLTNRQCRAKITDR